MRLAILTTHPIQYQVPWFRLLNQIPGVELTVLYCSIPDEQQQGDGFGVGFQWDIPVLDGYNYRVLDNVARTPSVTKFWGCDTPELFSLLKEQPFDALIVNGWVVKSCLQALLACKRIGMPCLVRGESNALRPRAWYKRAVHRLLLRQYSAFLAIGKANHQFYLENGVEESRIYMTPYGVDNEWFAVRVDATRGNRVQLRREWGIAPDAFVFLFAGKLISKKRPMDIIRAMAIGQARASSGGRWHVLVAGDGELRNECRELASRLGVKATFTGFLNQSDMPKAYAASDCLVLPSDHGETWGLVVNEAMASGLPAILSDQVGCHPDLIVPGITGSVFPCGNVEAFSSCLSEIAGNPGRCMEMGFSAKAQVRSYSSQSVVAGILEALDGVTRKGRS